MESAFRNHLRGIDVEAQYIPYIPSLAPILEEEIGRSRTHEARQEALLTISQAAGGGGRESHMTLIRPSSRDDLTTHAPAQAEQGERQAEQTDTEHEIERDPGVSRPVIAGTSIILRKSRRTVADRQPIDSRSSSCGGGSDRERQGIEEIRMIGDFDSGANPLWNLYRDEAKSRDEAHIQTLKDDMDGVLIFAGLFSASLTSFIIDSKESLKVKPADQMVFYLQQNVAMLNQISQQISSISPQFSIPSSPPPSYPTFSPSSSDVRVNVFWFMALIFSLSTAFLAILVQQWVRDYMHVFQRYSDPLKSARLRQYLHEGSEKWYMPVVARAVPGLLHVSLFLFFVGFLDFILNINTTVGLCTTAPIGFSGLFYISTTFSPVIYPQSPYQNSFSVLIWYLVQRLHRRTYRDRGSEGASKSVSSNMSQGQMQLAMEESEGRKNRDKRSIRWLVDSLTEEAEMELFVIAIPGSFNTEWGIEVWRGISEVGEDEDDIANRNERAVTLFSGTNTPTSMPLASQSSLGENVVHELSKRVAQLLQTCENRALFSNDEQWRSRTRACVETTASFVGCANAELGWFGDVGRLLGDIGRVEKTSELLSTGMDRSFVIRWICLSVMTIRPVLRDNMELQSTASDVISSIQCFREESGTQDEQALKNAQNIDDAFNGAWDCLLGLFWSLFQKPDLTAEEVQGILRNREYLVVELEHIYTDAGRLTWVDQRCTSLLRSMDQITHGITGQLPGIRNRFPTTRPIPFSQVLELFMDPLKFPIIPPGQVLRSLCSLAPRFRDILEGRGVEETRETLKSLKVIQKVTNQTTCALQRQWWRLQDLRDGGGLGFIVELFFRALKQLLSTSLSQESQSALYIGTFRAITSDWSSYKHSLGTQKILLDAVASEDGIFSSFKYPAYITDEFFLLLENMLDKQTGPHIEDALQQLRSRPPGNYQGFPEMRDKALRIIFRQSQI